MTLPDEITNIELVEKFNLILTNHGSVVQKRSRLYSVLRHLFDDNNFTSEVVFHIGLNSVGFDHNSHHAYFTIIDDKVVGIEYKDAREYCMTIMDRFGLTEKLLSTLDNFGSIYQFTTEVT